MLWESSRAKEVQQESWNFERIHGNFAIPKYFFLDQKKNYSLQVFIKCPSSSSLQELAVASINDEQSKHGGTGSVPGMGRFAGKKISQI